MLKKILIIDDDPGIREALKTILEGKYDVQEARNSAEGLNALKTFAPDLVVLDVMMESLDSGFDLARQIRQDKGLKDIKILMFTSVDTELDLDFKKYAGDDDWLPVDSYVEKPVKPKEFLAKVEKLI